MTNNFKRALAALQALADAEKARLLAGFFKTGKGQYADGDRFLGIPAPPLRQLAREYRHLDLAGCERLLQSPYNETRALGLLILINHFQNGDARVRNRIARLYLKNRRRVNNWNLVDASAPYILGAHLVSRDRSPLYKLARSSSLWDRRIAVVATFAFIRRNDFRDTLQLTDLLLRDPHDLIHKACGWMLREVGKRDQPLLESFLATRHARMPRTMLRYAIERFAPAKRLTYLRSAKGARASP